MEELVEKGLCRAIGTASFTAKKIKDVLHTAKIIPACNQGQYVSYNSLREVDGRKRGGGGGGGGGGTT